MFIAYNGLGPLQAAKSKRIIGGGFLCGVFGYVAFKAFSAYSQAVEQDKVPALLVSLVFGSAAIFTLSVLIRYVVLLRRLQRPLVVDGQSLLQGGNRVSLANCEVKPVYEVRGGGLWPLSEGVWFLDGLNRVLLAPSLLSDESLQTLHRAWVEAGREFTAYSAESIQREPVPRH